MAYKPEVHENEIYIDPNGTKYKVVSTTNDGVNVLKLNSDGTVDKPIYWPEKKWNSKNLSLVSGKEGTTSSKNANSNEFTFSIDDNGVLTITKDGQPIQKLDIRGPEGKPGANGMPGQNGAPGQKGQDGAPGQPGQDGAPGEKGQDGAPGKDGAPGPEGKQGATGPKGEDADLWTPRISDDGDYLVFVNQKGEKSERFRIRGAKGDTGGEGPQGVPGPAGPVYIPSVNADGDLSWSNNGGDDLKNPPTRNIKGDKGEKGDKGATFHPIVKDGVLYWHDDNGNLVNGITPVRITGAKGEPGEQGSQGLSAYQIWLKQGNLGTEQDFLDSLKGEKGTPAPPADFSFKDVEDFTCAIQKIDTNLIVDKDNDTDSPEEIVDKKIEAIKELREEGRKKGTIEYYVKNWFKEVTWWCAGADRDLLRMCPGDHSKYVGVGTVIIFTALMAFFSSSIALNLVFPPHEGEQYSTMAIVCGVFWALMIFFLDRFITNTMYSDGKVTISKEELFSGLPRIIIAIFLGIVISAPLELKIFEDEIISLLRTEIQNSNNEEIKNNPEFITMKEKVDLAKQSYEKESKAFNKYLDKSNADSTYYKQTQKTGEKSNSSTPTNIPDGQGGVKESKTKKSSTSFIYVPEFDDDKWNHDKEEQEARSTDAQRIYLTKLDSLELIRTKLQKEYNSESLIKRKIQDKGLYDHLSALHDLAMADYSPWFCEDKNSNNKIDEDGGSPWDTIFHRWWHFLLFTPIGLIMLLFILIDISPVLYKMMLADGNYDNYLHQEKLLAQDKIRLSLSNMLKKLDDSELKRVAPFIMGDIYEKMAGDSYVYKSEEEFKAEIAAQKSTSWFWRIWPLSMIRWMFWKEEEKPTAPVIILNPKEPTTNQQAVIDANEEVFEEVLEMKKKIILASYRRWYKTQHDCIICDDVNDENKAREPFDDEAPEGDDSEIHINSEEDSDTSEL